MLWIYCAISALDILCYKCFGYIVLPWGLNHSIPRTRDIYVFAGLGASAGSSQFQYICCICVRDCSCIMYIYCGNIYLHIEWYEATILDFTT